MNVYETPSFQQVVENNEYVGRGVLIGKTPDGTKAVTAYFIMGRSENSRNRVFRAEGDDIVIYPFDESKVEDPSLIIYHPLRVYPLLSIRIRHCCRCHNYAAITCLL